MVARGLREGSPEGFRETANLEEFGWELKRCFWDVTEAWRVRRRIRRDGQPQGVGEPRLDLYSHTLCSVIHSVELDILLILLLLIRSNILFILFILLLITISILFIILILINSSNNIISTILIIIILILIISSNIIISSFDSSSSSSSASASTASSPPSLSSPYPTKQEKTDRLDPLTRGRGIWHHGLHGTHLLLEAGDHSEAGPLDTCGAPVPELRCATCGLPPLRPLEHRFRFVTGVGPGMLSQPDEQSNSEPRRDGGGRGGGAEPRVWGTYNHHPSRPLIAVERHSSRAILAALPLQESTVMHEKGSSSKASSGGGTQ